MGKFKMPTVQEFLTTRRIYDPPKEPVWLYIEREMRENADRKPYNTKVANWLLFLKDLRYHYYCEAKANYNRLCRECGPQWYVEYSKQQRISLSHLREYIHGDLLQNVPVRVKRCFWDLGITLHIPSNMLMSAMNDSMEDPGLFMWILYTKLYQVPPSVLLPYYDLDAMLIMSAIVFIDLEECIEELNKLTTREELPRQVQPKKKSYYFEPNIKYGQYLQKMRIPCYSTHPDHPPKPKKPPPITYKFKPKSAESYERLAESNQFLKLRFARNVKKLQEKRVCNYKFWEAPPSSRNMTPKKYAYFLKLKMIKMKPSPRHLKYKPPYDNVQCHIVSVAYPNNRPVFLLGTIITIPTNYYIINGGVCWVLGEFVMQICGMFKKYNPFDAKCQKNCNCLSKWGPQVMDHAELSKCTCISEENVSAHCSATYFYPPKRHTPMIFDHAKIYQMDEYLEYVHDAFRVAIFSETEPGTPKKNVTITDLTAKELLEIFLNDLLDKPLLIPHLPEANLLNSLQEWVRRRVSGHIGPERHKQLLLRSQRRWLDLKHIEFRAQAYFIPFTLKHLEKMNWSHRGTIQKLFEILLHSFEHRTRKLQLEQCRLWWSTMAYDAYPNESFLDVFFTYMPGRYQDTLVVNPYCSDTMGGYQGRTCPLNIKVDTNLE